jgi:hypothetical protein
VKTSKILPGAALALAALAGLAYWAGSDSQQAQPQPVQTASDAAATAAAPPPAPLAPAAEPAPAADPPLAAEIPDVPAPEADEQQPLVARSMALFAEAVNKQDLGALEASGSSAFRKPENLVELRRNVQAYVDQGIDLSRLAKVEPEIEARYVDGRWVLAGAYRVESARIGFSFAYEQEGGEWRVAAMKVELP